MMKVYLSRLFDVVIRKQLSEKCVKRVQLFGKLTRFPVISFHVLFFE